LLRKLLAIGPNSGLQLTRGRWAYCVGCKLIVSALILALCHYFRIYSTLLVFIQNLNTKKTYHFQVY